MRVVRPVTAKTSHGHGYRASTPVAMVMRIPARTGAASYRGNWRCLRGLEVIGRNDSGSHFLPWCRESLDGGENSFFVCFVFQLISGAEGCFLHG